MRRTDQLAEPVLSLIEGLRQAPAGYKSVHPENRAEGIGLGEKITKESSHLSLSMY